MAVEHSLFTELFALWPHDGQEHFRDKSIAADMGVPRLRVAKWIARGYVPPWYWRQLCEVVDQRFGKLVTFGQLVKATEVARGPARRQDGRRAEAA